MVGSTVYVADNRNDWCGLAYREISASRGLAANHYKLISRLRRPAGILVLSFHIQQNIVHNGSSGKQQWKVLDASDRHIDAEDGNNGRL